MIQTLSNFVAELFLHMAHMLHMISAQCVARDLHMIASGPFEHMCWRQISAQRGDCKHLKLRLSTWSLLSLLICCLLLLLLLFLLFLLLLFLLLFLLLLLHSHLALWDSPFLVRSLTLGSWVLFIYPLLFCLQLFFVSTVFLPYWPIHLHFFHNPLHPVPLPKVRMWLPVWWLSSPHIHKNLTNSIPSHPPPSLPPRIQAGNEALKPSDKDDIVNVFKGSSFASSVSSGWIIIMLGLFLFCRSPIQEAEASKEAEEASHIFGWTYANRPEICPKIQIWVSYGFCQFCLCVFLLPELLKWMYKCMLCVDMDIRLDVDVGAVCAYYVYVFVFVFFFLPLV